MASLKRSYSTMSAGASGGVSKAKRKKLNPVIKSQVSYAVRRALEKQEELKISDTTINTTIDNTGTLFDLTDMAQGVTEANRVGNKCAPKWIDVRLSCLPADGRQIMRFVLFQWHADDGSHAPAATDILQAGLVTSGTYAVYAGLNNDDRALFRVLADWSYAMTLGECDSNFTLVVKRVKAAMRQIEFNGTLTTGTEKLYLLAISDSAAVSHPSLTGVVRVHYADL